MNTNQKIPAILQARMSSTRLPGKVMSLINGKPMIEWQIERILRAESVSHVVVATSIDSSDDELASHLESLGINVSRGSLDDVYSRFETVLAGENGNAFIRLTGDCPMVMPVIIDDMVSCFQDKKFEYLSNTLVPTFPDGLDVEIVSNLAFKRLGTFILSPEEREHVTLGLYNRPQKFLLGNFKYKTDLSAERWTVDYPEDLTFVKAVFHEFRGAEASFTMDDLLRFVENNHASRNKLTGELRNEALQNMKGAQKYVE